LLVDQAVDRLAVTANTTFCMVDYVVIRPEQHFADRTVVDQPTNKVSNLPAVDRAVSRAEKVFLS